MPCHCLLPCNVGFVCACTVHPPHVGPRLASVQGTWPEQYAQDVVVWPWSNPAAGFTLHPPLGACTTSRTCGLHFAPKTCPAIRHIMYIMMRQPCVERAFTGRVQSLLDSTRPSCKVHKQGHCRNKFACTASNGTFVLSAHACVAATRSTYGVPWGACWLLLIVTTAGTGMLRRWEAGDSRCTALYVAVCL
jgi:hypothetical protein